MTALRILAGLILASPVVVLIALAAWYCHDYTGPDPAAPVAMNPTRIASLTLATDEILFELVPADRIVCVTSLVDDAEISNVAGHYLAGIPRMRDSDVERIIGLNPDLVCVAPYNSADFRKVMERSGLPVYRNNAVESLDQIEAGILELGERVGASDRARRVVDGMQARRRRLAKVLHNVARRPRLLFWSAGFTAGRATTIDDILREAGGSNIAADMGLQGSAEIAPERVFAADPEFIIQSQWRADDRDGRIENHPLLRQLPAVREGRVIALEGRCLTSLSHFVMEAPERLARKLHPDRFGKE